MRKEKKNFIDFMTYSDVIDDIKVFVARQYTSKLTYAEPRKSYSSRVSQILSLGRNFLAVCTYIPVCTYYTHANKQFRNGQNGTYLIILYGTLHAEITYFALLLLQNDEVGVELFFYKKVLLAISRNILAF